MKIMEFCKDLLEKYETAPVQKLYDHLKDYIPDPDLCDLAIQHTCYLLGVQKHGLGLR